MQHRLRRIPLVQSTHSGVGEEVEAKEEDEDKLGGEGGSTMHEEGADSRAPLGPFAQRAMGSIKSTSSWESALQSGKEPTRTDTYSYDVQNLVNPSLAISVSEGAS